MPTPQPTVRAEIRVEFLLYSMAELQAIWQPALDLVAPRRIAEIGSEAARLTAAVSEWARDHDADYYVVEPLPGDELRALVDRFASTHLVEDYSPAALRSFDICDVYFIDGDHNYATVSGELATIADLAAADGASPLLILHDVAWPWAYRDSYYDPERLDPADRHEYTWDLGMSYDDDAVGEGGYVGGGNFAIAVTAGGPRNGVRCAVDDFVAEHTDVQGRAAWTFRCVPLVSGLGFLYRSDAPYAADLDTLLAPYDEHPTLARIEENRLRLFLAYIALRDQADVEIGGRQGALDNFVRDIANLQAELESLRAENTRLREGAAELAQSRWVELLAALEVPVRAVRPGLGTVRDRLRRLAN